MRTLRLTLLFLSALLGGLVAGIMTIILLQRQRQVVLHVPGPYPNEPWLDLTESGGPGEAAP